MASDQDFQIIDLLASEYGWSVEYISNLDVTELSGLCKAIRVRQDQHLRTLSYIILLAIGGKSLDSVLNPSNPSDSKPSDPPIQQSSDSVKSNDRDLVRVFQMMGMDMQDVIAGTKKGRLEF